MKRFGTLLAALFVVAALWGCSGDGGATATDVKPPTEEAKPAAGADDGPAMETPAEEEAAGAAAE